MKSIKLREKAACLVSLVRLSKNSSLIDSIIKQNFFETLVGAGIWYMPHTEVFWTGMISVGMLSALSTDLKSRMTKEHVYSRKKVANFLISSDFLSSEDACGKFIDYYVRVVGRYHIVTSSENVRLRKYQAKLSYDHQEQAYDLCGVRLVHVVEEDRKRMLRRDREVIQKYLI